MLRTQINTRLLVGTITSLGPTNNPQWVNTRDSPTCFWDERSLFNIRKNNKNCPLIILRRKRVPKLYPLCISYKRNVFINWLEKKRTKKRFISFFRITKLFAKGVETIQSFHLHFLICLLFFISLPQCVLLHKQNISKR